MTTVVIAGSAFTLNQFEEKRNTNLIWRGKVFFIDSGEPYQRHCKRLAEQRVASPMEATLFVAGMYLTVLLCFLFIEHSDLSAA